MLTNTSSIEYAESAFRKSKPSLFALTTLAICAWYEIWKYAHMSAIFRSKLVVVISKHLAK